MIIGNPIVIGGGRAALIAKQITTNGEYRASDDNADGYSAVTVAIPQPTIIAKTITANGIFRAADDDAAGYDTVVVDVPSGGGRCPRAEQLATMDMSAFFNTHSFVTTATEVTD